MVPPILHRLSGSNGRGVVTAANQGVPRSVCLKDDQGPRLRPAIIELSTARGGLVAPHAYLPLEKSSIFAIDTLTPASPPSSTRCCRDELARFGRHR